MGLTVTIIIAVAGWAFALNGERTAALAKVEEKATKNTAAVAELAKDIAVLNAKMDGQKELLDEIKDILKEKR